MDVKAQTATKIPDVYVLRAQLQALILISCQYGNNFLAITFSSLAYSNTAFLCKNALYTLPIYV